MMKGRGPFIILVASIAAALQGTVAAQRGNPERLPQSDNDRRIAPYTPKVEWKTVVISSHSTDDSYALAASSCANTLQVRLSDPPFVSVLPADALLSLEETKNTSELVRGDPRLFGLAKKAGVEAIVLLDVEEIELQLHEDVKRTLILQRVKEKTLVREATVRYRVKVLDAVDDETRLDEIFVGNESVSGRVAPISSAAISAAAEVAAANIASGVRSVLSPPGMVVDVRGNGRYAKISLGEADGITTGSSFEIYEIVPLKSASGEVISTDERFVANGFIVRTSRDAAWCDVSSADGRVMIGHIAKAR
jgi:hypothetical protein